MQLITTRNKENSFAELKKAISSGNGLEDILPLFPDELAEAFEPRFMSEEIDGERHEYADTLWIPSATDVFGAGDWWNEEPDSFQLEIFKRERDRVKEHVGDGTWFWWLRSPCASNSAVS